MIRTRLFLLRQYHIHYGNVMEPAADYIYCIYLFGFLIRSVPITGVSVPAAKRMFPENQIEKTE